MTANPMPMPITTTGIIHIEICTPDKSNAVVSIGIMVLPTAGHQIT